MHTLAVHYPDYSTVRTKRFYPFHVLTYRYVHLYSSYCLEPNEDDDDDNFIQLYDWSYELIIKVLGNRNIITLL